MNTISTSLPNKIRLPQRIPSTRGFLLQFSAIVALGRLLFGYNTLIIFGTILFIAACFGLNEHSPGGAVDGVLTGCTIGAITFTYMYTRLLKIIRRNGNHL